MSISVYYDLASCVRSICNLLDKKKQEFVMINHSEYTGLWQRGKVIKFDPSDVALCLDAYKTVTNHIGLTIIGSDIKNSWFDMIKCFGGFILSESKKHLFKNDQNNYVYSERYEKDNEKYTNVFFNICNQYHLKFSFYKNSIDVVSTPLDSFLEEDDKEQELYFCDIEVKHDIGKDIVNKIKWNGKEFIGGVHDIDMDMIKIGVNRAIIDTLDSIIINIIDLYTGIVSDEASGYIDLYYDSNWEKILKNGIRIC